MKKYEQKKKELAAKGMPNPKVSKNVTGADRAAEMGPIHAKMGKKTFMGRVSDLAEKSDKQRTGQSGRYFESRFDEILGKKRK